MKNRILLLSALSIAWVLGGKVNAQSLEAGYGHFGAMIYWQGKLPGAGGAEIRRTGGPEGRAAVRAWKIQPAGSTAEFLENSKRTPPVFEGLWPFTEKSASYYVDKLAEAGTTESIPAAFAPNVLFALGLAVWDTTVTPGHTYQYQAYVNGSPMGNAVSLQTTLSEVYDWAPTFFDATHDEIIIRCKWRIPREKKPEVYSYLAYRTAPFQPGYELVSGIRSFAVSPDTTLAVFMDTTSRQTPGIYQYIIRPVDRFGLLGPVSEYAIGSNFPPEAEPIMVYFKATGRKDEPVIRLDWRLRNPWRIRTMRLFRSRSYNGPYELLGHIAPEETTYSDHITDVMESYFYYFEMDDIVPRKEPLVTARVTSVSSYEWPAIPPDSVEAEAEGKKITIRWKRAAFQDRGYYILRAQGYGDPDTAMIVSPFIHVAGEQEWYTWSDTSSHLSPQHAYTYAVISESIGYEKSIPSASVTVQQKVPQYIPPPADLRISRMSESVFLLSWSDLSADESLNHLGYRVFKKDPAAKDGYSTVHDTMLFFETNYIELTGVTPQDEFVVKAYTIFGDESAYAGPVSYADPFFYRFGPQYLMGRNEENGIFVHWNKPLQQDIAGYTLYRIGADKKAVKIATPGTAETSYLDTNVKSGETYYYFITAMTSKKLESEASEVLYVTR